MPDFVSVWISKSISLPNRVKKGSQTIFLQTKSDVIDKETVLMDFSFFIVKMLLILFVVEKN